MLRVFRIVGSRNSRAADYRDETVRCLHTQCAPRSLRHPNNLFDFSDLADEVLPFTRAELTSLTAERAKRRAEKTLTTAPSTTLTQATYYEAVLTDLQKLRMYRYGDDGHLPTGMRDEWLFLATCAMSHLAGPSVLGREVKALAKEAGGWTERETTARLGAALQRANRKFPLQIA